MNEHKADPVETGAEMDYKEHEKTYSGFINGVKFGTLIVVALLVAMAAGFFTTAGFFSATILFFILVIIGFFLLR